MLPAFLLLDDPEPVIEPPGIIGFILPPGDIGFTDPPETEMLIYYLVYSGPYLSN